MSARFGGLNEGLESDVASVLNRERPTGPLPPGLSELEVESSLPGPLLEPGVSEEVVKSSGAPEEALASGADGASGASGAGGAGVGEFDDSGPALTPLFPDPGKDGSELDDSVLPVAWGVKSLT